MVLAAAAAAAAAAVGLLSTPPWRTTQWVAGVETWIGTVSTLRRQRTCGDRTVDDGF